MIPESPRWLLDKGRYRETEEILDKICQSNNTCLPAGAVDGGSGGEEGGKEKEEEVSLWAMFTHRVLIVRMLVIVINW